MIKEKVENDFYTTQELVDAKWFPVRSTLTIKKLIESRKLEAVDISTSINFKRYRISKKSVEDFMENQNVISTPKKTIKKTIKKKVKKKN